MAKYRLSLEIMNKSFSSSRFFLIYMQANLKDLFDMEYLFGIE